MKKLFLTAAVLFTTSIARADVLECGLTYLAKADRQWRQPRQIYGVTCEPGRSPRFQTSASYPFHIDLNGGRGARRTLANEGYMVPLSRVIALASYRLSYEGGKLAAVELSLGYSESMCDVNDRVTATTSVKVPLDGGAFEFSGDIGTKDGGEQPVRLTCQPLR